jgi:hypothetical protein
MATRDDQDRSDANGEWTATEHPFASVKLALVIKPASKTRRR